MDHIETDLVVIGAGPGGYVAAIRGAALGLRTAIVESTHIGGVCLNWGCIPSKALIEAAHTLERLKTEIPAMGIEGVEQATINAEALQRWKNDIVKKLTSGVKALLKGNKVQIINGFGRLTSRNTVSVAGEDGSSIQIEAQKGIIVATGGTPAQIPGFAIDGKDIIGAKEAVSLTEIPRRLAVIGGGVIGLELGTVLRKLGSSVTVIEAMPTILPGLDPDLQSACAKKLRQFKMNVLVSSLAKHIERTEAGLVLRVETKGEQSQITVDKVLIAAGMKPKTDGLGFEDVGVEIDKTGFVRTSETRETTVPGIYAVGDIAGMPMLAHKASFEGEVAAEAIAGLKKRTAAAVIPSAIFTDPEIGTVGKTEQQAIQEGYEVKIGKFYFAASGKAMALQETAGLVKVVADAKTDRALGVHIAGPHASDLLGEAALAVITGMTAKEVGEIVHAHPTLSEVLMEGFLDANKMAIHTVRR